MHIWLIHIGEPLPVDGPVRLFRYGLLAKRLVAQGHRVTQWAGTLNHFVKKQRTDADATIPFAPGYDLRLMHGPAFSRHVGLGRLRYQRAVSHSFRRQAESAPRPDLIVASLPTLGLADEATQYGKRWNTPVVVDIRDLWPDIFERVAPRFARPLTNTLLRPARALCRRACVAATSLVSVSEDYLQWGLDRGDRRRSPLDAVFPHGYERPTFSNEQQTEAVRYWDAAGIANGADVIDGAKTRLCFFGSLGESSALGPFLHAVRSLHAAGRTDIELVVCGDGPKRDAYRRIAGDCPVIRWSEWIDQPKIVELMQRSQIGVAAYGPNAPQSLPNKPIEYLAGGLAVLSTLGDSELQTVLANGDCGETLSDPTPASVAERITAWADDPKRLAERRHHATQQFARRFEAAAVYDAMADHLQQIHAIHQETAAPLGVAA